MINSAPAGVRSPPKNFRPFPCTATLSPVGAREDPVIGGNLSTAGSGTRACPTCFCAPHGKLTAGLTHCPFTHCQFLTGILEQEAARRCQSSPISPNSGQSPSVVSPAPFKVYPGQTSNSGTYSQGEEDFTDTAHPKTHVGGLLVCVASHNQAADVDFPQGHVQPTSAHHKRKHLGTTSIEAQKKPCHDHVAPRGSPVNPLINPYEGHHRWEYEGLVPEQNSHQPDSLNSLAPFHPRIACRLAKRVYGIDWRQWEAERRGGVGLM